MTAAERRLLKRAIDQQLRLRLDLPPEDGRLCIKCDEWRESGEFYGRGNARGARNICRKCANRIKQQWREANRERENRNRRAWRARRRAAA